jgi:hypothetical protein
MSATPDQSSFEVGPPSTAVKRPLLVWVILAFYLLDTAAGLALFGTKLLGPPSGRLDAEGHVYTAFDYFESAGFIGLKLYAAIMLFRLRRIAVKLFLAALLLNFVATGYDLVSKGLPPPGGPVVLFSLIIGFGILVLICLYAWWLERRRVLT